MTFSSSLTIRYAGRGGCAAVTSLSISSWMFLVRCGPIWGIRARLELDVVLDGVADKGSWDKVAQTCICSCPIPGAVHVLARGLSKASLCARADPEGQPEPALSGGTGKMQSREEWSHVQFFSCRRARAHLFVEFDSATCTTDSRSKKTKKQACM